VISAEAARQPLASLSGVFVFFSFNRNRIPVLEAGKTSMGKARAVVMELPQPAPLGPEGLPQQIPAENAAHRAHRHFFKDIEIAGTFTAAA